MSDDYDCPGSWRLYISTRDVGGEQLVPKRDVAGWAPEQDELGSAPIPSAGKSYYRGLKHKIYRSG